MNQSGGNYDDVDRGYTRFETLNDEEFENFYKEFLLLDENNKIKILKEKLALYTYRKTNIISDSEFTAIKRYYEICLEAVKKNGLLLQYLNNNNVILLFSFDTEIYALKEKDMKNNEYTTEQIEEQIEERQKYNQRLNNFQFKYLQICTEAVRQNEDAIHYLPRNNLVFQLFQKTIKDYCDFIKLLETFSNEDLKKLLKLKLTFNNEIAVQKIHNSIVYKKKKELSFTNNFRTKQELLEIEKYYEICMHAVKQYPLLLQYVIIDNLHNYQDYYEICFEAVEKNGCALQFVRKFNVGYIYKKICDLAVQQNPDAKKYIK